MLQIHLAAPNVFPDGDNLSVTLHHHAYYLPFCAWQTPHMCGQGNAKLFVPIVFSSIFSGDP
jgi:hypothetical protein